MADQPFKRICVVKFGQETERTVFTYIPRTWITAYSGKNVTVILPNGEEAVSESTPTILNMLPSYDWKQYEGTIIYETDNVEEALQVIDLKNNAPKEANKMMSSCTEVITSIIKDISTKLQSFNEHGLPASSGTTNKLNTITMLEIVQPIIAELHRSIDEVIRVNSVDPVMNEKLKNTNRADAENILRLKKFSNEYVNFYRNVTDHHINSFTARMKSPSVLTDEVMMQNVKIFNEIMSTLIVTLSVMNGNIN
uniref:Uncharacterized protein n=1 Tax=Glyptapanteles indiensis TaxID=92994 RepID=B7S957_GLYIN|nr:hypothetical protein GIP_L8_0460 [Glyptapanteles indiensis]